MSDLLELIQSLLRHPILLAQIALPTAVLFGVGRELGLPLLFWHERRAKQLLAGMSATVLIGEILFVAYLADRPRRLASAAHGWELQQGLQIGGVIWGAMVIAAWLHRRSLRTGRDTHDAGVVTPLFRKDPSGELAAADPPSWPFIVGSLMGAGVVAVLAELGDMLRIATASWAARMLGGPQASLHVVAASAFALMLVLFLLSPVATPAVAMCLLIGLVAAAYGGVAFWLNSSGIAILLAVALFLVAGLRARRLPISSLEPWYAHPVAYPPPARAVGAGLLRFNEGWPDAGPRPLIIVCASGGGIRAATWTAAIITELDRSQLFRPAVRLITGASGGMVGAAFWVARMHNGGTPNDLLGAVAGDALSAVAHRLVYRDIPFAFLPLVNAHNRGHALELEWNRYADGALGVCIGALRERERAGQLPSLVFSPMIVEDGRRLILSNLDLSAITRNEVRWLGHADVDTASVSAFHIDDIFPGALDHLPLYQAARLSASFPYVSPASTLPTEPSRRVVDAGYYDNYGLSLACEWLRECLTREQAWLKQTISRVLVLQIRDNVSELSVSGQVATETSRARPRFGGFGVAAGRGFEWLTGPISGVLSARESVMLFRNDAALEAVTRLYDAQLQPGFLRTTIFEFKGEASLSWYLTEAEFRGIRGQATSDGVLVKIREVHDWLENGS